MNQYEINDEAMRILAHALVITHNVRELTNSLCEEYTSLKLKVNRNPLTHSFVDRLPTLDSPLQAINAFNQQLYDILKEAQK